MKMGEEENLATKNTALENSTPALSVAGQVVLTSLPPAFGKPGMYFFGRPTSSHKEKRSSTADTNWSYPLCIKH